MAGRFLLFAAVFFGLGLGAACSKNPDRGARLNPPTGLRGSPGDHRVSLQWKPTDSTREADYNIYQAGTRQGPFKKVAVTRKTRKVIHNLSNGRPYYFKVTASLNDSAESAFSNQVEAVPGMKK